jgi:hypothetical protein
MKERWRDGIDSDDDASLRADLKRPRDRRAATNDDHELRAIDALIIEFEFAGGC